MYVYFGLIVTIDPKRRLSFENETYAHSRAYIIMRLDTVLKKTSTPNSFHCKYMYLTQLPSSSIESASITLYSGFVLHKHIN